MFWRFGFHSSSAIDSLLDQDAPPLKALLDQEELLQECKSQNTRLIDYLQRKEVLQQLLAYVTGQIEGEEEWQYKYSYLATEVLCSEIWSIVETCISQSSDILAPFWENVLDRPSDEMKTQTVMASHFVKINATFMSKKPAEMLEFIQTQPNILERILDHLETPPFMDLIIRIINLDERPECPGVLEWLSSQEFIPRLIQFISPVHSPDVHSIASELIRGIISIAAPSPGAGLADGLSNGPASNRFARELAQANNVEKLAGYILSEYPKSAANSAETSATLPSVESTTSSVLQSISVFVELIRKNNSDYYEPYLFHTLRNRLIQVQQHLQGQDARDTLEQAMKDMVNRIGVVHLGPILEAMCDNLETLQNYLKSPRSLDGQVSTTLGPLIPLTFERYRICELYAELLHCSNMSLLNRSTEYSHLYDNEGRLQGGLSALEELAQVIAISSGEENKHEDAADETDEIEPALELPVSNASHDANSLLDSDEDMSDDDDHEPGSSDDDESMEEIAMYDEPPIVAPRPRATSVPPPDLPPSSTHDQQLPPPLAIESPIPMSPSRRLLVLGGDSDSSLTNGRRSVTNSMRSVRRYSSITASAPSAMPIGERLKRKFLDLNVLGTLLDLFFDFPWNNFLHSVVYDVIHQILTGRVDGGLNRELIIALFRDGKLMHKIVEGQHRNDRACEEPKGVRLGYMGHLTLISEDVIAALEHYPLDLRDAILPSCPQPDWDDYVNGRYSETKKRDMSLLGGGKPALTSGINRNTSDWKVDEEDASANGSSSELNGALNRNVSEHSPTNTADFGPPPPHEDDEDESSWPPQFTRYLAQEMHVTNNFGSSSSDTSDDDDDEGWLARSQYIEHSAPPRPQSERRPLDSGGFDDAFDPSHLSSSTRPTRFLDSDSDEDDDTFGPFSDSAAATGDPFAISGSFTEDLEDSTMDSLGDFGDFQAAEGSLTPTMGSWTLTSEEDEFNGNHGALQEQLETVDLGEIHRIP